MHRSSHRRSPSPHRRSRRSPSPHRRRERRSPSPSPTPRNEKALPESFSRDREDGHKLLDDNRDVLERMAKSFDGGPLEDFYKCIDNNTKLKVWTRNYKEVRGICTGYLIAFDKHWNLVMRDVDEVYLKPRKPKTPYLDGVERSDIDALTEMEPKVPRKKKTPEEKAKAAEEAAAAAALAAENKKKDESVVPAEASASGTEAPASGTEAPASGTEAPASGTEKPATEKKKRRKKKKSKDSVMDKRYLDQLFIRGDNIVMVALLNEEMEDEEEEAEKEEAS